MPRRSTCTATSWSSSARPSSSDTPRRSADSRVLAVVDGPDGTVELFLERTPFYAESGGQIGDTGTIVTETGTAEVLDTTYALPNLRRHTARLTDGVITTGQTATATIDVERRDAIRRNHTGTHLLHHALREVLGDHVKQAGSMVGPDRLRFDFSHYESVTPEQIARDRGAGQRGDAPEHADQDLRDDQGRGRGARRDRLLRRQVRRHRPRPRGRFVGRTLRWNARPSDR